MPLGLDYAGVEALMRMRAVPRAERAELTELLQVIEAEQIAITVALQEAHHATKQ